ncbi:MAG: DNA-binding NtrC family response regulator [Verrucomicrobiales bacterium]|jgi:DNA-binding NtrC family response regulator
MSVAEAKAVYDTSTEWDLIFTDAMLPDGTGLEIIDHVLKRAPDSRILLSSGYSDNRALLQMAEDRRLRFLGKPYTVSTLYSAVRDVLDNNLVLSG